MTIRSLEGLSLTYIANVFREAFADYSAPMQLTDEEFAFRMRMGSVRLEWSVGYFEDDRLVAFILTGYRDTEHGLTFHNSGTGVIPAFRGQRLTGLMYEYLTAKALEAGAKLLLLEVIQENQKALSAYEKAGLRIERGLAYWRGLKPEARPLWPGVDIQSISAVPWEAVKHWWHIQPAWPATPESVDISLDKMRLAGAFVERRMAGYLAWLPYAGRVYQLCVDPELRRRGIGRALIRFGFEAMEPDLMTIANVDEGSPECAAFFAGLGFELTVRQWEMGRSL